MITVMSRGTHWLTSAPVLLMLRDEQESEKVYRFFLTDGQGKITFITKSEFSFTKDVITGKYRKYEVKNEQSFKNGVYLELSVGMGKWNCYILPTGLPNKNSPEKSILVTKECITKTAGKD